MNELSRRRERDATQREVDKLRASIQTLTRSANPLGKLMDFLQEDVDSMQVSHIIVYLLNCRMPSYDCIKTQSSTVQTYFIFL